MGVLYMDLRKIIKFGKGSYVISIPKSWIEKNRLKKGDLVAIDEGSDQLVLHPNNLAKKEESKITIEASNKSLELIKAEVVSAYLNNYDNIEIISKDLKTNAPAIKSMLMDLAGLEILEQTSSRILAKDLIDIQEVSVDTLIRRMDIIIRAMIEDVIKSVNKNCHYESIYQRDFDVNRLYFLAKRVIRNAIRNPGVAKVLKLDAIKSHHASNIVMRLERIGDNQKRIARHLREIKLNQKARKELEKLYTYIKDGYLDVMKAHYKKDKKLAYEVELSNKDRIVKCNEFLKKNHDVVTAKIIENVKAMTTFVKYIARDVIGGE